MQTEEFKVKFLVYFMHIGALGDSGFKVGLPEPGSSSQFTCYRLTKTYNPMNREVLERIKHTDLYFWGSIFLSFCHLQIVTSLLGWFWLDFCFMTWQRCLYTYIHIQWSSLSTRNRIQHGHVVDPSCQLLVDSRENENKTKSIFFNYMYVYLTYKLINFDKYEAVYYLSEHICVFWPHKHEKN